MDNLEEECEEEVFLICDTRERYPEHCAEELGKCIELTNDICMAQVLKKTTVYKFPSITEEQDKLFELGLCNKNRPSKKQGKTIEKMQKEIDNLKGAFELIRKERHSNLETK